MKLPESKDGKIALTLGILALTQIIYGATESRFLVSAVHTTAEVMKAAGG